MLASISLEGDSVTVLLPNGRRIIGKIENDIINVVENTTTLSVSEAECAIGVAYDTHLEGDRVMVWRRLAEIAQQSEKKINEMKWLVN